MDKDFYNLPQMRAELAALSSEPWAIIPEYLTAFISAISSANTGDTSVSAFAARARSTQAAEESPIAGINISGVITPKPSFFSMLFGGTALTDLAEELRAAAANTNVSAIVLNVDSPGGSVGLVPETAAVIRAARKAKPVVAVANTSAASAAYWLASQADELVVTPSGMVGSIGVFMTHGDESGFWQQLGVNWTMVSAGKYKVEGNPYEPLSDEASGAFQKIVDAYYGMFTADVAVGRSLPVSAVADGYGEGRMLTAQDALAAGMVDSIDTLDSVLAGMVHKAGASQQARSNSHVPALLKEMARYEHHKYTNSKRS